MHVVIDGSEFDEDTWYLRNVVIGYICLIAGAMVIFCTRVLNSDS